MKWPSRCQWVGPMCAPIFEEDISVKKDADIVFYSENCAGQEKNKYALAIYLYAVRFLGIRSICYKFLIKGHTLNEGGSAHSLIEQRMKRMLKSGPMYIPEYIISVIRSAKSNEVS
ncbi:hypothetical protein PR048_025515 [Dryococelus australis]|uniref:Uncharacterized protein n=1 Tax=Dryococelus australis TaxID=614101 RepID=A0ABQ9GRN1_9NEOP|nr:hypothetical protein PR048_025515 [Dryococelus australis]